MGKQARNPSAALCQLGVDRLWRLGLTGQGVGIGHLDSGVDPHPVLGGSVARFGMPSCEVAGREESDRGSCEHIRGPVHVLCNACDGRTRTQSQ